MVTLFGTLIGIVFGLVVAALGYIFINAGTICDEKSTAVYSPDDAPARFVYSKDGRVYKSYQFNIPPTQDKIEMIKGSTYEVYICSKFPAILITSKEVPSSQYAIGICCIIVGAAVILGTTLVNYVL